MTFSTIDNARLARLEKLEVRVKVLLEDLKTIGFGSNNPINGKLTIDVVNENFNALRKLSKGS